MAGVTVAAARLRFEKLSELVADSVSLGGLAMLSSGREGGLTRDDRWLVYIYIIHDNVLRVSKHVTESIRNIARGVGIS